MTTIYETWEQMKSTGNFASSLFEDEHGFRRAKGGVGRDTIVKFLGGNWTGHQDKIGYSMSVRHL